MGRKGWFATVKRVFISDSTKKEQKHPHKSSSKLGIGCFGHHNFHEDAFEGAKIAVVPSLPPRKDIKPRSEADSEHNKQAFSLVLATAVAAGAAVAAAQAASEAGGTPRSAGKAKKERAAIIIQAAFRRHLARKSFRRMRGKARLKTLVQGHCVQRQTATTLQCMQTFSRLQSQVRARKMRISEDNQSLQRQMQQKREKEFDKSQAATGEKWDDSSKSKEQIEAKLLKRQVAAMRREKALAYASTHQQTWRNATKSANSTFMDPNNPHWGWNWLERWMAARPWEGQNTTYQNDHASSKSAAKHTMSVGEITKLYTLRDQKQDTKNSPASQIMSRPGSFNSPSTPPKASSSSNGTKAKTASSTRGGSWGGDGDLGSMFRNSSENNRRHSIAGSPVKADHESIASSSPAFPRNTATSTTRKVAKPKSIVKTSSLKNGAVPEKAPANALAKKRLSFPASAAGTRRHSLSGKVGNMVSNKNKEEKVKVKNGGSR